MLIHSFDPVTGQYQASMLAMADARDGDRWIMPAFTTAEALPDRPPRTWPYLVQGTWELREDWRGVLLYRRDNGDAAEIVLAGITLDAAGLTLYPRPDDEHKWSEDKAAWVVDEQAVAARVRREAQAQLDTRMGRVREKLFGKTEAYTAGLLTPLEVGVYKAWAAYGLALGNLAHSPDFPTAVEWPAEPDEAAVAVRVAKEIEEAAQRAHEEAEARAAEEMARLPWGGDAEAEAAARAAAEAKLAKE
jgi:hypothetical protein